MSDLLREQTCCLILDEAPPEIKSLVESKVPFSRYSVSLRRRYITLRIENGVIQGISITPRGEYYLGREAPLFWWYEGLNLNN